VLSVVDEKTPESALDAMGQAGIRASGINLATGGSTDPASPGRVQSGRRTHPAPASGISRCIPSWPVITGIKESPRRSPVPVVFDHFAGAKADLGAKQPGFADCSSWCARQGLRQDLGRRIAPPSSRRITPTPRRSPRR